MGNAGIALGLADDRIQIDLVSVMLAARTEQKRMAGRSIGTLVDGGHPAGHRFRPAR